MCKAPRFGVDNVAESNSSVTMQLPFFVSVYLFWVLLVRTLPEVKWQSGLMVLVALSGSFDKAVSLSKLINAPTSADTHLMTSVYF